MNLCSDSSGGSFRGYAIVDWNGDGYLDIISRDLQSQCTIFGSFVRFSGPKVYPDGVTGRNLIELDHLWRGLFRETL